MENMKRLQALIGSEQELKATARAFKLDAEDEKAQLYGAMLLTCADESECECAQSFQETFVNPLLPKLKYAHRAPFRMATLGSHYEWGAVTLTDNHFVSPEHLDKARFIGIKINAHVARTGDTAYGEKERYGIPSYYCGALRALLEGVTNPWLDRIRAAFESEGIDRLDIIHNKFSEKLKPLIAGIVNSRLQARKASIEIQSIAPVGPAVFVILTCVTLNVDEADSEFVTGMYVIDRRGTEINQKYFGLGDDPSKYEVLHEDGRLKVQESSPFSAREARNHRTLAREAWAKQRSANSAVIDDIQRQSGDASKAQELLHSLVDAMSAQDPSAGALLLFSKGAVGLHNLWTMHQLILNPREHETAAETMIQECRQAIGRLSQEQAQQQLEKLMRAYKE